MMQAGMSGGLPLSSSREQAYFDDIGTNVALRFRQRSGFNWEVFRLLGFPHSAFGGDPLGVWWR